MNRKYFKFQSDSINTISPLLTLEVIAALNSNLILLILDVVNRPSDVRLL